MSNGTVAQTRRIAPSANLTVHFLVRLSYVGILGRPPNVMCRSDVSRSRLRKDRSGPRDFRPRYQCRAATRYLVGAEDLFRDLARARRVLKAGDRQSVDSLGRVERNAFD